VLIDQTNTIRPLVKFVGSQELPVCYFDPFHPPCFFKPKLSSVLDLNASLTPPCSPTDPGAFGMNRQHRTPDNTVALADHEATDVSIADLAVVSAVVYGIPIIHLHLLYNYNEDVVM
jgi:hypothetical protein